jgi:hypothetical protein
MRLQVHSDGGSRWWYHNHRVLAVKTLLLLPLPVPLALALLLPMLMTPMLVTTMLVSSVSLPLRMDRSGAKNGIFFPLCLSRACLGKMFVFI